MFPLPPELLRYDRRRHRHCIFSVPVANSGEELVRYQDGTTERDRFEFADFDHNGELFAGGYTKGSWSTDSTSLDFVGVKFERLSQVEASPDLGTGAIAGITGAVVIGVLVIATCES